MRLWAPPSTGRAQGPRAAGLRTQRDSARPFATGQRTSFRILRASSWAACSNSLRCLAILSSAALIFFSESAVDLCMALHRLSCSASSLSSVLVRSLSAVPTVSSNSATERCSFLSAFFCVVVFCGRRGRDGGRPRRAGRLGGCAHERRAWAGECLLRQLLHHRLKGGVIRLVRRVRVHPIIAGGSSGSGTPGLHLGLGALGRRALGLGPRGRRADGGRAVVAVAVAQEVVGSHFSGGCCG